MKRKLFLVAAFLLVALNGVLMAQTPDATPAPEPPKQDDPKPTETPQAKPLTPEERALKQYYESLRSLEYRLGPEDVMSVTVFGHDKYSKSNITVPPDGRIGLPLIVGGVVVTGKTTLEVQQEVTKALEEYVIDPKVTVTLDKAASARYGIIGHIAAPGAKTMNRRLTLFQAIVEAGGVLSTGSEEKVVLLRFPEDDKPPQPQIFNLKEYRKGKGAMVYLQPGDTIVVPGKGFSLKDLPGLLGTVAGFRGIAPGVRY
jgi:polysaccharide export outer membrane protein